MLRKQENMRKQIAAIMIDIAKWFKIIAICWSMGQDVCLFWHYNISAWEYR